MDMAESFSNSLPLECRFAGFFGLKVMQLPSIQEYFVAVVLDYIFFIFSQDFVCWLWYKEGSMAEFPRNK